MLQLQLYVMNQNNEDLDASTIAALGEALDDEYKARATYEAVMQKFGVQRPFQNIMQAEIRHANALLRIFHDYQVAPPVDRWTGKITAPDTLQEAYALGVAAEIENESMYQKLMNMTNHPRVLRVFENLRRASQENHLPAFQRHLNKSTGKTSNLLLKTNHCNSDNVCGNSKKQPHHKRGKTSSNNFSKKEGLPTNNWLTVSHGQSKQCKRKQQAFGRSNY